jgi:hypothetical protein
MRGLFLFMAHQEPRQEIINKLTRLLLPATQKTAVHNSSEEEKKRTLQFLKERSIPGRRVYIVVVEDTQGHTMHFTCYVEQDSNGNWQFRGAAGDGIVGSSPGPVFERAWANLGGGGMPYHFYAGGFVANHEHNVARVRLNAKNGTTVEDTVEDGMVLFLTDQRVDLPIEAELYTHDGQLIYSHKVLS